MAVPAIDSGNKENHSEGDLGKLKLSDDGRLYSMAFLDRAAGPAWPFMMRFSAWAIALLALFACGAAEQSIPCQDDRRCLRYALSTDIPLLDPHFSHLPEAGMIFRQIYDTLVYRDGESGEFRPGLAIDWEISEDGLVYTFRLRRDVLFHDGTDFSATAVAQNIERIFRPESEQSLARKLLAPLRQYEVLDQHTIRLRLFEPHAALLDSLAQPFLGIASPKALNESDGLRYQYHQSGTGPFALASYLPGELIVLRRFGGYAEVSTSEAPMTGDEIDRVEFSIITESEVDWLALLGDSQDVVDNVSSAAAQSLANNSRVVLMPIRIPGQTVQYLFNTNRKHLTDREVRLALLLATNRIGISDQIFYNTSPVAWAPLAANTGYAHSGFINEFEFDLDQARALLEAAGYADSDGDGILEKSADRLELTVLAPPWGQLPELAAFLKDQWRLIGINLIVEPAPGAAQLNRLIQSGEYDLLPIDNYGLDPGILSEVFLDSSLFSSSRAPHTRLNDLLIRAAIEQDAAARRNQYYEVQSILMSEVLLLPIRENVRLRAVGANIESLRYDAYGFYPILSNVIIAEPQS